MKPTPDEIEAKLATMRAGESDEDEDEDTPLWCVAVFDPKGNERATGFGLSLSDARAAAWIMVWVGDETLARCWGDGVPLDKATYENVPRHVAEGWRFEIDCMPTQGSA